MYKVDGFPEGSTFTVSYEVNGEDLKVKSKSLANLQVNETLHLLLRKKESYLDVHCVVTLPQPAADEDGIVPSAPEATYSARVDFSEVPDEEEMREELEAIPQGSSKLDVSTPLFHIKTHYDRFDSILTSRVVELEQLEANRTQAENDLQEVKKKLSEEKASDKKTSAAASKPTTKKTTSKKRFASGVTNSKDDKKDSEEDDVAPPAQPSYNILQSVVDNASFLAQAVVAYRSVFFFGIAAVVINQYGDYASV